MATLKQLETFITVAECQKMSEAAKKLYISQPTVSQVISDLEKEYESKLFNRGRGGLKLTTSGQVLLTHATKLTAAFDNMEQAMKNAGTLRTLRIGATLTIGNTLIDVILEELKAVYPDIEFSVYIGNTQNIEKKILDNQLDIALVEGVIVREQILTQPVLEDELRLICGKEHDFAGREQVQVGELANENFILREEGSGTRLIFENMMMTNHVPFVSTWECSSRLAIVNAVSHGWGIGILSTRSIKEAERDKVHSFSTPHP